MFQASLQKWTKDYCLGTQMPYSYSAKLKSCPPEGYQPFYFNYMGRHGGRYLTNPWEAKWILNVLKAAYKQQELTLRGLELLSKMINILEMSDGCYNRLNYSGTKTIEEIAHRLCVSYPQAFGRSVIIASTYKERTKDSMECFAKELAHFINPKKIVKQVNTTNDPVLRFYDLNHQYQDFKANGPWILKYEQYVKRCNYSENILGRIFNQKFLAGEYLCGDQSRRFLNELFKIYTNQFDMNGVISLGYYFMTYEKQTFWENSNVFRYLEKGPSLYGNDLPTNIAFPLLIDFIRTSDHAIRTGNISANVRFGHSEAIIPFASLLHLSGCCEKTDNISIISSLWKDYQISPIAANIQWIFYRRQNPRGEESDYLVRMEYNEQEIEFPIQHCYMPYYYVWNDVRTYYKEILRKIGVNSVQNMQQAVVNYEMKKL